MKKIFLIIEEYRYYDESTYGKAFSLGESEAFETLQDAKNRLEEIRNAYASRYGIEVKQEKDSIDVKMEEHDANNDEWYWHQEHYHIREEEVGKKKEWLIKLD